MTDKLPTIVRYIKNGEGSRWWKTARCLGQIHAGWSTIPNEILNSRDFPAIEEFIRIQYGQRQGFRQDFNQLLTLLDRPEQFLWTTIEDGCLWWCTAHSEIIFNETNDTSDRGHFWLNCKLPWNNRSVGGRELATANLPGAIEATRGFRGTICEPGSSAEMLRVIRDEEDVDAIAAAAARCAYELAVVKLTRRLHPKDFETLVDLILLRSGWARIAKLGGVIEGVDIEVENAVTKEIAFVQVKCKSTQSTLNDYVSRFRSRPRYARMIFAVHTPEGDLIPPDDHRIQVWDHTRIAELVVKHGLGDWIANRV